MTTGFVFRGTSRFVGSNPCDTLAERLKQARARTGMSRVDFCKAAGVSESSMYRLEFGLSHGPNSPVRLKTIADVLGVNPVWLFAGNAAPARFVPDWYKPPAGVVT